MKVKDVSHVCLGEIYDYISILERNCIEYEFICAKGQAYIVFEPVQCKIVREVDRE